MYLAWGLLAAFLVFGLILYEKTGLRLGGVLVLPLLLVYALFDLNVVAVFALASAASLLIGQLIHTQALLYGRRLLYVFLIVGIGATLVAKSFIGMAIGSFIIALLPGLFAYNLHREGRYVEGTSAFMLWFGVLLTLGIVVTWLAHDPGRVTQLSTMVMQQMQGTSAEGFLQDGAVRDALGGAVAGATVIEAVRDTGAVE